MTISFYLTITSATKMSMNNLTIDGEFRYIVQWFNEWSELQRDDFVPILVKFITGSHLNDNDDNDEAASTTRPVNMNGLPNDLEINGRPMSLFQCRIKLFNQWNRRWPTEFKEKLLQKITEIDGKVGEKILSSLNPNNSGGLTNGYAPKEQCQHNSEPLKENAELLVNVPNYVESMMLSDPMIEVLNNETSVDDIETNEDIINNIIEQPPFNGTLHDDGNDVVADGNIARHNQPINERAEPVQQVIQIQNLQINEEKTERDYEDVTATVERKQQNQQQLLPSVTATVNPIVVTQAITTNAEVPLVV